MQSTRGIKENIGGPSSRNAQRPGSQAPLGVPPAAPEKPGGSDQDNHESQELVGLPADLLEWYVAHLPTVDNVLNRAPKPRIPKKEQTSLYAVDYTERNKLFQVELQFIYKLTSEERQQWFSDMQKNAPGVWAGSFLIADVREFRELLESYRQQYQDYQQHILQHFSQPSISCEADLRKRHAVVHKKFTKLLSTLNRHKKCWRFQPQLPYMVQPAPALQEQPVLNDAQAAVDSPALQVHDSPNILQSPPQVQNSQPSKQVISAEQVGPSAEPQQPSDHQIELPLNFPKQPTWHRKRLPYHQQELPLTDQQLLLNHQQLQQEIQHLQELQHAINSQPGFPSAQPQPIVNHLQSQEIADLSPFQEDLDLYNPSRVCPELLQNKTTVTQAVGQEIDMEGFGKSLEDLNVSPKSGKRPQQERNREPLPEAPTAAASGSAERPQSIAGPSNLNLVSTSGKPGKKAVASEHQSKTPGGFSPYERRQLATEKRPHSPTELAGRPRKKAAVAHLAGSVDFDFENPTREEPGPSDEPGPSTGRPRGALTAAAKGKQVERSYAPRATRSQATSPRALEEGSDYELVKGALETLGIADIITDEQRLRSLLFGMVHNLMFPTKPTTIATTNGPVDAGIPNSRRLFIREIAKAITLLFGKDIRPIMGNVWRSDFREQLKRLRLETGPPVRSNPATGDLEICPPGTHMRCSFCGRRHPVAVSFGFSGTPYTSNRDDDPKSLISKADVDVPQPRNPDSSDSEEFGKPGPSKRQTRKPKPEKQIRFNVGRGCYKTLEHYHNLRQWERQLKDWIATRMKENGVLGKSFPVTGPAVNSMGAYELASGVATRIFSDSPAKGEGSLQSKLHDFSQLIKRSKAINRKRGESSMHIKLRCGPGTGKHKKDESSRELEEESSDPLPRGIGTSRKVVSIEDSDDESILEIPKPEQNEPSSNEDSDADDYALLDEKEAEAWKKKWDGWNPKQGKPDGGK